jgi:RNA polymerase sigma-70 factor (ECF subfamily)
VTAVLRQMRDDDNNETLLVRAAQAGDAAAFTALFRRHVDRVRTHLTRLIGPIVERDDLVQQVFLALHRSLGVFRADARLSTFLHRITVNAAYDHLRTRQRRRVEPLDPADLDALLGPGLDARTRAEARADLRRLFELLERLTAKKRIAFVLVAVEGLTLAEAAALVDADEDTVKQRVRAARRELEAHLERDTRREEDRDGGA